MGLDMYLNVKEYISERNPRFKKLQKLGLFKGFNIKQIEYELGYWRKANAIHNWFVNNVQKGKDDCEQYSVSIENLKHLLKIVNEALTSDDPNKILPTQSGFFFGSTEIDDWYMEDLKKTKVMIKKILKIEGINECEMYYQSNW